MIARFVISLTLWIALWGDLSVANLLTGLIVTIGLVLLFPPSQKRRHRIRIIPAISFFFYMLRSIIVASVYVIAAVLFPNEKRRHVEIIRVSINATSPLIRAVIANTISLTPGTAIVAVDDEANALDIHVLGKSDGTEFQDSIHAHEDRVAAFIVERS
jgi:multicomponent Na+:H+ antiporter subunit E